MQFRDNVMAVSSFPPSLYKLTRPLEVFFVLFEVVANDARRGMESKRKIEAKNREVRLKMATEILIEDWFRKALPNITHRFFKNFPPSLPSLTTLHSTRFCFLLFKKINYKTRTQKKLEYLRL